MSPLARTAKLLAGMFAGWLSIALPASALTIIDHYVPAGEELSGIGMAGDASQQTIGGGSLQSIVRAAANHWERMIPQNFTLTVNYGWYPTSNVSSLAFHQGVAVAGTPARQVEGSIAFSNDSLLSIFMDPTPLDNTEFGLLTTLYGDLGGGPVNILREYAPASLETIASVDMLSTAIHEIGHALGLAGWPFFTDETSDGAIDVTMPGHSGTSIPMQGTHINLVGPALSAFNRPLGTRRLISDVDLLAVSQVSRFSNIVLPPGADLNGDWQVDGLDLNVWMSVVDGAGGDANGDNLTDSADFLIWQQQFGWGQGTSTSVPEPAAAMLIAETLIGFCIARICMAQERRDRRRSA